MDISLSGANGIELIGKLSDPENDKPIMIAVTSHNSENDLQYFEEQGFATVINKPFSKSVIVDAVETVKEILIKIENDDED